MRRSIIQGTLIFAWCLIPNLLARLTSSSADFVGSTAFMLTWTWDFGAILLSAMVVLFTLHWPKGSMPFRLFLGLIANVFFVFILLGVVLKNSTIVPLMEALARNFDATLLVYEVSLVFFSASWLVLGYLAMNFKKQDTDKETKEERTTTDWQVLRTYETKAEAQMFAQMLEANGVPAKVSADDEGGQNLALPIMSGGVKLLVRSEDIDRAKQLLDSDS